ncbi:penicillin acylase family protein [soil metagenome]
MKLTMRTLLTAMLFVATSPVAPLAAQQPSPDDIARWERQAQNVEIIRDRWGIAHVHGRTDADAVFGMEYAQAEYDFNRIERNYLVSLGRLAEAEGESAIWQDLRARIYAGEDSLRAQYAASPAWLKALMDAFADGLNYYLYTHPAVEPLAITRFEPWMALSFTEGSIGGDIERINLNALRAFYDGDGQQDADQETSLTLATSHNETTMFSADPAPEPRGSNGFAIAPQNTLNGNALLYINPHTSFYFRSELQMTSDEGLNAYGAVTWGQFFIYQGFNENAGWMHTSSGVDNIDEFLETHVERNGRHYYRHGNAERPMSVRTITVPYRTAGGMAERTFTVYGTHHGPVVRREGDHWVSVAFMWQPVNALIQSYSRTKAKNLDEYLEIMRLHTNASNATVYADREGNIAYLHSNYIPRRDPSFDWTRPVDGSDPRTDYDGVLTIEETPNVINPSVGWTYNTNNWPWSASGPDSPRREDYPAYVETNLFESARGHHALRVLPGRDDFTIASLTAAGYDSFLPAFEMMVPALVRAYDALPAASALRTDLAAPVTVLRNWDYRYDAHSVATSLAVFWGEDVLRHASAGAREMVMAGEDYTGRGLVAGDVMLESLAAAVARLEADFGTWQTPWGHINRFQRISPSIAPEFDDAEHSIPVPFTSARWGSLASFGARPYPNTKRWYGTSGNSFIASVEFGDSVKAHAVTAGGESGDPASPHFNDQAAHYAMGALREVYFYPADVARHMERRYRPGQR